MAWMARPRRESCLRDQLGERRQSKGSKHGMMYMSEISLAESTRPSRGSARPSLASHTDDHWGRGGKGGGG